MPPFLALFAATLSSVPGFVLSYYLISGRRFESASRAWAGFAAAAPVVLPIYAVGAFVCGFFLWVVLKSLGQLNLAAFMLGSLVPPFLFVLWSVIDRGGAGPGLHIVLLAFSIPCLVIGFTLWFFSVRWPLGA